ncbi:xanthine dehydrogenase family protein molybdopterin-binding subunit [Pseudoduganella violaceinigra]|uniref:xanthine dehydrogenase family protein molybdopterin-binding subunit n=1 Tax=Pseudoduganella violaceinigra TaxID=246602 RepID=UPI000409F9F7|nr:xanthine dehydrogenase family protein molybdopterin-binding subunit [Pseudoduganella violaceinigra]
MKQVGQAIPRTDGRAKVTGSATFAAEHALPRLAHAVLVLSTIPNGRLSAIDTARAQQMRGVLAVMTHRNAPRLPREKPGGEAQKPPPPKLNLLQDDAVNYNGQPIAVVVAETLEQAQDAARAVKVHYAPQPALLDFQAAKRKLRKPKEQPDRPMQTQRGNVQAGLSQSARRIDVLYTTPVENHNPMEPHATIAAWEGDQLTLYDATQYVSGVKKHAARALGIPAEKVRVVSPYVGGGFGCKGNMWSHVVLAAMAARMAGRPVKLALERPQMFAQVGARPMTEQRFRVGASAEGHLLAVAHDTISHTSVQDDFTEPCSAPTRILYASDSLQTTQQLATLNVGVPTYMRAPGEASGSFALECAIDEMAYALDMDPVALRLQNYAEEDPEKHIPFSSKQLRECYKVAAERFGWAKRTSTPRSMTAGRMLVGWGMATATYPANRMPAKAWASIAPDGTALVRCGSQDIGTGTYTIMTQIAADALGLPLDKVRFELGDSDMPEAPVSGGSMTAASVGPAVHRACTAARDKLLALAVADRASPLFGFNASEIEAADGWLRLRSMPARAEPMAAVIGRNGGQAVNGDAEAGPGEEKKQYSMHSFGAVFVEVQVDPDLGTVRVPRVVACYDVGTILNAKTARSQFIGGIVWGLGMALMEKTEMDWRYGRAANANLADYHVPVNADVGDIDVVALPGNDTRFNELGARGIGEIGIVGVAAAVANAVYHATGKRVRDLPLTLDKLI